MKKYVEFISTIFGYATLGPLLGAICFLILMPLSKGTATLKLLYLAGTFMALPTVVYTYSLGLLPALVAGVYVAFCNFNHRKLSKRLYYILALIMPAFICGLIKFALGDAAMNWRITPLTMLSGLFAAWVLLIIVDYIKKPKSTSGKKWYGYPDLSHLRNTESKAEE